MLCCLAKQKLSLRRLRGALESGLKDGTSILRSDKTLIARTYAIRHRGYDKDSGAYERSQLPRVDRIGVAHAQLRLCEAEGMGASRSVLRTANEKPFDAFSLTLQRFQESLSTRPRNRRLDGLLRPSFAGAL